MGVKEYKFAGDNRHLLNEYHRQLDSLGEWIIQFDAFDKQDYGFDKVSNKKGIFSGSEYYPYLSANYDLRYKSVETGKSDKVKIDFGSYPKDSVIFKDKYGVKLKFTDKNILTFTGTNQADTNYIYAYRGDQKIGKLMLNVYKKKPIKVCLVMVNGAKHKESFDEIKNYLDKVYTPAVVEFEILHADFKMPELTSFSHGGSPWNSVYNDDQKRVLRAYNDSIKDGIYYLFFIDNVTDKKDGNGTMVSGYMPRGYNAGFIYDGGSPHTIAHELGHGIAGLEHVFENSKSCGKTNNLMDYASGEELWHFQWDAIQDPSRVWMKWNKDESEGESVEINYYISEDKEGLVFSNKTPFADEEEDAPGYYNQNFKFIDKEFIFVYDNVFRYLECVKKILDIFRDKNNKNALIFEDHRAKLNVGAYGQTSIFIRSNNENVQCQSSKVRQAMPTKNVYTQNGKRLYTKGAGLNFDDLKKSPSNYTLAVKITLYTAKIWEDYGSLINKNDGNIYRVKSDEIKSVIRAQMLLTLGHEMFIHFNKLNAVLKWSEKKYSEGQTYFSYDSGSNGGDKDHQKYIRSLCREMNAYIKELKAYIHSHPEYGITDESLNLVIKVHDNKYIKLKNAKTIQ